MTEQKTFKRRVRERMEKTGESYTSARAALVGAEPPGVYPDTSALRFALAEAGTEISEALALIIAGGAGAASHELPLRPREDFTHFHLSGWNPFQSDIVAAVERLQLHADIHETSGAKTAAKALRERLETGIQIAWVEDYTVLAVVALDEDRARVYDRTLTTVSTDELAERRARVRKQRHRLLAITPGTADVAAAVRAASRPARPDRSSRRRPACRSRASAAGPTRSTRSGRRPSRPASTATARLTTWRRRSRPSRACCAVFRPKAARGRGPAEAPGTDANRNPKRRARRRLADPRARPRAHARPRPLRGRTRPRRDAARTATLNKQAFRGSKAIWEAGEEPAFC